MATPGQQPKPTPEQQRKPPRPSVTKYFVRYPEKQLLMSAAIPLANKYQSRQDPLLVIGELVDGDVEVAKRAGAKLYPDILFHHTAAPGQSLPPLPPFKGPRYWEPEMSPAGPAPWAGKSLWDVLQHTKARDAWALSTGSGTTIVIADTGISRDAKEFPDWKRARRGMGFAVPHSPWLDDVGHGSMCACIAAATDQAGGKYRGVAPDATLLSARTTFEATDLYKIYDRLIDLKKSGELAGPVVISNSYAYEECGEPVVAEEHPFTQIVRQAVSIGMVAVFAAGNNHVQICQNKPAECKPNTIWATNSIDEVLCVGTVNWENSNSTGGHANSSRGPGQWAKQFPKPDCVAPTYGEVLWGKEYRKMEWWGTSGATPQVAGLAALILSRGTARGRDIKPAEVAQIIRDRCKPISGAPPTCVGRGVIDCLASLQQV